MANKHLLIFLWANWFSVSRPNIFFHPTLNFEEMASKYISECWFSERWPTTIFSSCSLPPWSTATGMGAGTQKQSKDMSWEQKNSNFISRTKSLVLSQVSTASISKVVPQIIRCVIRAMDELISDHVAWDNKTAWVAFTFTFHHFHFHNFHFHFSSLSLS